MNIKILAIAALLSLASPASAQQGQSVIPGHWSTVACGTAPSPCFIPSALVFPLGYQQITSLSSSTALTLPTGASMAVVIAESQTVRWRDDGTNPTASVGMPLTVNSPMVYTGPLASLKFIQTTASATLNIAYYR